MKYLIDNPEFYKYEPPIKKIWEQVHVQATAHTQRLEVDPVLDKVRPNEPQMSKDYRQENRRLITKADISRFVTKCQRIFEASGIKLVPESLSEVMRKWLESEPFYYLGQYSELEEYMYRVVLPEAIEDPNALLVVWPYSAYSEEPPAYPMQLGGHPANEQVPIDVKIIPSSKVVVITENVFGWLAGKWLVDKNTWHNYYYFADETFYYRVYPVKDGSGIKYEWEVWYYHNIQDLPLNILPGFLSKYKSAYYNESVMHGYFEYADEFKARFTDANNRLKQKLTELNELRGKADVQVKSRRKERETKVNDILRSKEQIVEEKIKTRKKLTTEDLLVFQKMDRGE